MLKKHLFIILFTHFLTLNCFAHNQHLSFHNISDDYQAFYSNDRLLRLGGAFLLMSTLANTQADEDIQNWYQQKIRNKTTDQFSWAAKQFGEKKYMLPATLALSKYDQLQTKQSNQSQNASDIANWGSNTARAYTVGTPAMLLMQVVTGGSRPTETPEGSKWRFMNDNNGVSGHAFMGAVPFLTIAKMNPDNDTIKIMALLASTFTAWSRVNDNSHYLSQAMLGWYMAYESVDAVFDVNDANPTATKGTQQTDKMLFRIGISRQW